MKHEEINKRLETLKLILICFCLCAMLVSSCQSKRSANEVLSKITTLQSVVQEVKDGATCCPVPKE